MQADALFQLDCVKLGTTRLCDVTLTIPRGITALLGASGAGKTSLLNVLAGFEKPSSGKLHGDTRVAWAPQGDGLWPGCTAGEHLTECGATKAAADAVLGAFDLAHLATTKPSKLSRGEQSRLALARALAMTPRTLVLDEPLAHVDSARSARFWRVIREHVRSTGASLIFATHAPEIALAEAEHVICVQDGSVVFTGKVADLYDSPASPELADFLGPANWLTPDLAQQWLGESWGSARCVRPERVFIETSPDGPHTVCDSRFLGSCAETTLRSECGETHTFIHRPAEAPRAGLRAKLHLLLRTVAMFTLLALSLGGCKPSGKTDVIPVKSWRTWMLPTDGAVQPTPRSLTTGPHDALAVMDTAGRVLIYDANGALLRQWKMLDVQFGKPEGIVWLKDDRIVVCDTHYRRLVWFDQQGHVLKTVGQHGKGRGEFIYPVGICKDAAENLYVCEYGGNDRIQVFTREGEWLREFGSPGTGAGQFQRPSGLVWHGGKVFIADAINNRIHIFSDAGKYIALLGAGADGKSALTFNLPYDITLAPDGNFYVIEYGGGRLLRISPDGKLLGQYGHTGRGDGEFATPWGLTVDSQMRVLVADTMNRRIVSLQL